MDKFTEALKEYVESNFTGLFLIEVETEDEKKSMEELGFTIEGSYAYIDKKSARALLDSYENKFDMNAYWEHEKDRWPVEDLHKNERSFQE